MPLYINFYFRELLVTGDEVTGVFNAPDDEVICEFKYNISTKDYSVWNNNKPLDDILPLPFYWLDFKLKKNGKLNSTESKSVIKF